MESSCGYNPPRIQFAVDPRKRLQWAWEASLNDEGWARETIATFHEEVRRILDDTRLTQAWSEVDLPPFQETQRELRGALLYMKPFRRGFWKRNVAALLRSSIELGIPMLGSDFWQRVFPEAWLAGTSSPSPLSPSRHVPADLCASVVYARNEEYQRWAGEDYLQRLAGLSPAFHRAARECPYDPDDGEVFERHARILSGAAALVMAEWLGLNEEQGDKLASRLDIDIDTQFRARKDRHVLWPPTHKRPYVDLWLDPVLAQVLVYESSGWDSRLARRSLPLRENETRGYDTPSHLLLNRVDIEMAVWCEVVRRLLDKSSPAKADPQRSPDKDMETPRHDPQKPMNAFDRLLPYQVPLAEAILQATRDLVPPASGTARFARPDHPPLGLDLDGPGNPAANGIFLLPPEVTTPVLEDDRFYCQLDWRRIAPEGDWMDIRLFLLPADGGPAEYLEYEEDETEDAAGNNNDDSPVCLRLHGAVWDRLAASQSATTLAAAFGRAVFGFRPSRLGTGAFVLGIIDLNRKSPS